jgi:hypothetical protein
VENIAHDLDMGEETPLERLAAALEEAAAQGPRRQLALHNRDVHIRELALRVLEDHERRLAELEAKMKERE